MCGTQLLASQQHSEAEKSNASQGYSPFFVSARPQGESLESGRVFHVLLPAIAGTAISPPDIQLPRTHLSLLPSSFGPNRPADAFPHLALFPLSPK